MIPANRRTLAAVLTVPPLALLMGSAAHAAEPFKLVIGGDAYFEAGFVGQDRDNGLRSSEFRNRMRVVFTPSAKADNGLEYGARLRIRASSGTGTTDADRSFIFVNGSFGSVRLGMVNSYNDDIWVARPIDYLPLASSDGVAAWLPGASAQTLINGRYAGTDLPVAPGAGSALQHSITVQGTATKVVYYSPRFAGLQAGLSYTPRTDSTATDVNRVKAVSSSGAGATTNFQDIVELGLHYKNSFDGVDVAASAAYNLGKASSSASAADRYQDLRAFQIGARVGYAGFSLGAGYVDYGKSGQNKNSSVAPFRDSARGWNVGVQYVTGPWTLGGGYVYGQDAGSYSLRGARKLDVIELGVGYQVAPGLQIQAQYDHFRARSDKAATTATGSPDDNGNVALLRSVLTF